MAGGERATLGWSEIDQQRKREIIDAISNGRATSGPVHLELDLTDRCNVACYFCNQMDVRTKQQIAFERVTALVDELTSTGLKAVRLSGGGDPLAYRQFGEVQDYLAAKGVVIDNLTTNGALLTSEISRRLVRDQAREVIFSLNSAGAEDYGRMMRVKPAIFEQVIGNIRQLVQTRDGGARPAIVVQFLIDWGNFHHMPRMYELGCALGVDRIAISPVLEIPNDRIEQRLLLEVPDRDVVQPYLEEILRRDRERANLQLNFPWPEWNEMVQAVCRKVGWHGEELYPVAPSFDEAVNGQCFFGWYSAAIHGNGDIHPCCMLMGPDQEPLGNLDRGSFASHWQGHRFDRLREEMREVFLARGRIDYSSRRFQILRQQCVHAHACAHKKVYFQHDDAFYGELRRSMDGVRSREVRWLGTPSQILRAARILWCRLYHGTRNRSLPLRSRLGSAAGTLVPWRRNRTGRRLYIGTESVPAHRWSRIDVGQTVGKELAKTVSRELAFADCKIIFLDSVLSRLHPAEATSLFLELYDVLGSEKYLRLTTPDLDWIWTSHYRLDDDPEARWRQALMLNRAFYGWRHRFHWNRELLERVLSACGFADVRSPETELEGPSPVIIVEAVKGEPKPALLEQVLDEVQSQFVDHLEG